MFFRPFADRKVTISSPFLLFVVLMFFVYLADAVMSYLVPVVIESVVGSTLVMGIILSTSSMFGLSMDFLFAKYFPNKTSIFFLKILFFTALAFPTSLLISVHPLMLIFAMAAWGIYFEAMLFANYHMIHELVHHHQHAWAWGILTVVHNVAYVIGPLFATMYSDSRPSMSLILSLVFFCIAIYIAVLLRVIRRRKKNARPENSVEQQAPRSFATELSIWYTFEKVLWPLLGFMILAYLVEAAFFSIGPLYAEQLKHIHPLGGTFVSLYSVPGLIIGFLLGVLAKPFGKKRLAYTAGIVAGSGLLALAASNSIVLILLFTFVAATGMGIVVPSLMAVFEDFVSRSGKFGNDLIGLTTMSGSIAYTFGPLINGFMGEYVKPQHVFGVWGGILIIYSIGLFFIVKRKVRLPKHELDVLVATKNRHP